MKKMMFYLIFLSLMACKKVPLVDCNSPTKDPDIARQLIEGKWNWKYSNYFNRRESLYEIWTPENTKSIKTMDFSSDGNLCIFENGKLVTETKYEFRKLSALTNFPADSTRYIVSWKDSNTTFRICSDSLYLPYQSFRYDAAADEVWEKQ
jgi:hypothetical protein